MDVSVLGFYAMVCGLLSVVAPRFGTPFRRFALGALIGLVAAAVLPNVLSMIR